MKIRQKLLTAAVVTVLAAALLVSCAGNKTAKNLIGDWTFEAKGLALTAHFDEDGTYAFRFADRSSSCTRRACSARCRRIRNTAPLYMKKPTKCAR